MEERKNSLVIGLWKFEDKVGFNTLAELADEWAKDEKYIHLYLRGASKTQIAIGFTYDAGGTKEGQDKYFDETSDHLKRKFGNDLVGWDMSSSNRLIKGF